MLTRFAVLSMFAGVLLFCAGAGAQLTDDDLDALRARGAAEGWTFDIVRTSASQRPPQQLSGLALPAPDDPYWKDTPQMKRPAGKADFPAVWDWRAMDGVTPPKDQGPCGSCWAFSTIGAVESAIKIADGLELDLSEQHLLSCNDMGWGCSGAVWGYAWLMNTPDCCGMVGAVLEAEYPYVAYRGDCDCLPERRQRILDWSYVNGLQPGVDDIKYALTAYGPVGCSLYTNSAFHAYGGGVFNACDEVSIFDIGHAVMIVGWDDTLGTEGAWIVKNSWGTDWGLGGFGYMEYGCNHIGFAANYPIYVGSGDPLAVSPDTAQMSEGPVGGPFSPDAFAYTVENTGGTAFIWNATTPAWLDAQPASGNLAAGGHVNVTVDVLGTGLAGGFQGGDVIFENLNTGVQRRRWLGLDIPKPVVYAYDLDTDPGWAMTGDWAFGAPNGLGCIHGADPASAYTGANVYGYNLNGCYSAAMGQEYLTAGPLDFSGLDEIEVRFMRWLGVENHRWDEAVIEASGDGTNWLPIWENPKQNTEETEWTDCAYDLSAVARDNGAVYVRWVMGPTDNTEQYAGWNIDDIEFRANPYVASEGEDELCDIDAMPSLFAVLLAIADADNDGALAEDEVVIYVPEVAALWFMVDINADGVVTETEFVENAAIAAFLPELDTNGNNTLDYPEVLVLTDIITPDLYTLVDVNSNGTIDCADLYPEAYGCPDCVSNGRTWFAAGDNACLTVPGEHAPGAAFQWSKLGVGTLNDGRYVGTRCASLYIENLQTWDSGTYLCEHGDARKDIYSVNIVVSEDLPIGNAGVLMLMALLGSLGLAKRAKRR